MEMLNIYCQVQRQHCAIGCARVLYYKAILTVVQIFYTPCLQSVASVLSEVVDSTELCRDKPNTDHATDSRVPCEGAEREDSM